MKTVLRFALVTAIGIAAASTAAAQEKSWVGELVMPTKPAKEIQFGDRVGDKQVTFPFSGITPIKVRDDREGWLRIHDGYREGWVDKADFVLVRDAPAYFHRRVQANPKDMWALYMRAVSWNDKGEPDNAIKDYTEYIRLVPTFFAALNGRGNAWMKKKDYDRAIADYNEAIRLNPESAVAYNGRGNAWGGKKDYDKAIADYNEAIRLSPVYSMAFYNRGNHWYFKKVYNKAIADWDEAIRLDPKFAWAYGNRSWVWATCPDARFRDGKRAVDSAKKQLELDPKNANSMGILAASYAETGDFVEAVRWLEKAMADPQLQNDPDARRKLELYRAKKPYRDE